METTDDFDLNARLESWRREMLAAGLSPDRVAELESHLLDAMEGLRSGEDRSESAVFAEATARIGSGVALGAEFARADAARRMPPLLLAVGLTLVLGGLLSGSGGSAGNGALTLLLGIGLLRRWPGFRTATLCLLPVVAIAAAVLAAYYAFVGLPPDPTGFRLSLLGIEIPHPGAGRAWLLAIECALFATLAGVLHWAQLRPEVRRYFATR